MSLSCVSFSSGEPQPGYGDSVLHHARSHQQLQRGDAEGSSRTKTALVIIMLCEGIHSYTHVAIVTADIHSDGAFCFNQGYGTDCKRTLREETLRIAARVSVFTLYERNKKVA